MSRREEVARCAVFLAWADAAYRTGADLAVDAGRRACSRCRTDGATPTREDPL